MERQSLLCSAQKSYFYAIPKAENVISTQNYSHSFIESKIEFPTNLVLCNKIVFLKKSIKIQSYLKTMWVGYYILNVLPN
jgi:hypothetical protein